MGRKKYLFDKEEPERENPGEFERTDELEEIDLESDDRKTGAGGKTAGPGPLGFWAVMLMILGMSVLSSVIALMLWFRAG